MKQILVALAVIAAFAAAGRDEIFAGSKAQVPTASNDQKAEVMYRLGRSATYENLTIYTVVYAGQDQQRADYATLGEAMEKKWIEIVEMPEGGQVSQVTLKYTGKKPLLILAGELLLGGQQDRVVAEDTVIDPLSTVVVKVYCVEPGRWGGRTMAFGYAGTQVPTNVKEQAILSGQSEVWARTSGFNSLAMSTGGAGDGRVTAGARGGRAGGGGTGGGGAGGFGGGGTGGYGGGRSTVDVGLKSTNVVEFTKNGKAELSSLLDGESTVVGLIFIIKGEIKLLELFGESTQLASSYDPILGGVLALASVTEGDEWNDPTKEKVSAFLTAAIAAEDESKNSFLTGVGKAARRVTGSGVRGSVIGGGEEAGHATHASYFPDKQEKSSATTEPRSISGAYSGGRGGIARDD